MKQEKMPFRLSLSMLLVLLSVLLLMVGLSVGASASSGGQYHVVIQFDIEKIHDEVEMKITYREQNGETNTFLHTFEEEAGNREYRIPGIPMQLYFRINGSIFQRTEMSVRNVSVLNDVTGSRITLYSGDFEMSSSASGKDYTLYLDVPSSAYQQVSSFQSVSMPACGVPASDETASYALPVPAAYDQYGVRWYQQPSEQTILNPRNGAVISNGRLILTADANAPSAYTLNVQYRLNNYTQVYPVTVNPFRYTVQYLDADGNVSASFPNLPMGSSHPSVSAPVKAPDDDSHYTFAYWITSNGKQYDVGQTLSGLPPVRALFPIFFGSAHDFRPFSMTPATCVTPERTTLRCAVCDYTKQVESAPSLGHAPVELPAVAPTCTREGLTAGEKCGRCGAVLAQQTAVPMTEHVDADNNAYCDACGYQVRPRTFFDQIRDFFSTITNWFRNLFGRL